MYDRIIYFSLLFLMFTRQPNFKIIQFTLVLNKIEHAHQGIV
jgi:hypothetical protein